MSLGCSNACGKMGACWNLDWFCRERHCLGEWRRTAVGAAWAAGIGRGDLVNSALPMTTDTPEIRAAE